MSLMVPALSRDLFSPYFTLPRLKWNECDEKYVNDKLDRNELKRWDDKKKKKHYGQILVLYNTFEYKMPTMPVLISAPTGFGKNYFVLHNLRDFA